jgi:hypothetical protein
LNSARIFWTISDVNTPLATRPTPSPYIRATPQVTGSKIPRLNDHPIKLIISGGHSGWSHLYCASRCLHPRAAFHNWQPPGWPFQLLVNLLEPFDIPLPGSFIAERYQLFHLPLQLLQLALCLLVIQRYINIRFLINRHLQDVYYRINVKLKAQAEKDRIN